MEFKISDSLKKLIKQYFSIDFDEFKIKKINHYNQSYKFIFTNNISYIKIVFNEKYILSINFFKDINSFYNCLLNDSDKALMYNENFNKIDIFENGMLKDTISSKSYDFSIDIALAIFLKISNFQELKREVNENEI